MASINGSWMNPVNPVSDYRLVLYAWRVVPHPAQVELQACVTLPIEVSNSRRLSCRQRSSP